MKKFSLLITLITFPMSITYTMNFQYEINKRFLAPLTQWLLKVNNDYKPYENASTEYESRVKQVQKKVGIPEKYHLPAKKIPHELTYGLLKNIPAFAAPDAIYYHQEAFDEYPYEYTNFAIHHEIMHHKNNDCLKTIAYSVSPLILFYTTKIISSCTHIRSTEMSLLKTGFLSLGLLILGVHLTNTFYKPFMERRADKEALAAINCFKCAEIITDLEEKQPHEIKNLKQNAGYLLAQEFYAAAKMMRERNFMCQYHQQSLNDVD